MLSVYSDLRKFSHRPVNGCMSTIRQRGVFVSFDAAILTPLTYPHINPQRQRPPTRHRDQVTDKLAPFATAADTPAWFKPCAAIQFLTFTHRLNEPACWRNGYLASFTFTIIGELGDTLKVSADFLFEAATT